MHGHMWCHAKFQKFPRDKTWHLAWHLHDTRLTTHGHAIHTRLIMHGQSIRDLSCMDNPHETPQNEYTDITRHNIILLVSEYQLTTSCFHLPGILQAQRCQTSLTVNMQPATEEKSYQAMLVSTLYSGHASF